MARVKDSVKYLNMVGNKSAVTSNGNRELIVATHWLVGHEIQFKNPTVNQRNGY